MVSLKFFPTEKFRFSIEFHGKLLYDSALKITHGPLFGPVLSYLNQTGPKSKISTLRKWTKIKIGKISGHVILIFGEKLERTKTENTLRTKF